jgi:hypothetical protein
VPASNSSTAGGMECLGREGTCGGQVCCRGPGPTLNSPTAGSMERSGRHQLQRRWCRGAIVRASLQEDRGHRLDRAEDNRWVGASRLPVGRR